MSKRRHVRAMFSIARLLLLHHLESSTPFGWAKLRLRSLASPSGLDAEETGVCYRCPGTSRELPPDALKTINRCSSHAVDPREERRSVRARPPRIGRGTRPAALNPLEHHDETAPSLAGKLFSGLSERSRRDTCAPWSLEPSRAGSRGPWFQTPARQHTWRSLTTEAGSTERRSFPREQRDVNLGVWPGLRMNANLMPDRRSTANVRRNASAGCSTRGSGSCSSSGNSRRNSTRTSSDRKPIAVA